MKLLTFGYTGTQVAALAAALDSVPGALLVDVRLSPYSRATEWCAPALRLRFGARYMHLRQFGNLNYKQPGPVELADAAGGVRALLASIRPLLTDGEPPTVVLMCACRDALDCHRSTVAAILQERLRLPPVAEFRLLARQKDCAIQLSFFNNGAET